MLSVLILLSAINLDNCDKFIYKSSTGNIITTCELHWDNIIKGLYKKECKENSVVYLPIFDKKAPTFEVYSMDDKKITC